MRLFIRLTIPALIACVTLIACAGTSGSSASPTPAGAAKAAVSIKGFAFTPATLEVAKGTVVTFKNEDTAGHTVTSGANRTKDDKFDKQVAASAEESITFDTAGTFEYFCRFHSSMKATVVVK